MTFVVLYDANVLYPNAVRDLLIRIAQAGLVQAKWTDEILDETFRKPQGEPSRSRSCQIGPDTRADEHRGPGLPCHRV